MTDKLRLAIDCMITNETPTAITITTPTVTVWNKKTKAERDVAGVSFKSIPNAIKHKIEGFAQTTIQNIIIDIPYSSFVNIGLDFFGKLKNCEDFIFYVDVSMSIGQYPPIFVSQENAKEIKFNRDSFPSRLTQFLPACSPTASKTNSLVQKGYSSQLINDVSFLDTLATPLTADTQETLYKIDLASSAGFAKSGEDKTVEQIQAEKKIKTELISNPTAVQDAKAAEIASYKAVEQKLVTSPIDLIGLNRGIQTELMKVDFSDAFSPELNAYLASNDFSNTEGLGCACNGNLM
jgi:hypothetical protein